MKKKLMCTFSLLLVIVLLLLNAPFAMAIEVETPVDEPIIEEYVNITGCSCECYISGITLYASANVTAKNSMALSIKIEVQKLKNGVYSTIETWNASKTGYSLSLENHRAINIFSTYRIKVTFTAGGESTTLYDYA